MNLLFLNLGTPEMVIISFVFLIPLILIIVCLVDIVRSDFKDSTVKLLWAVIVILAPVIGGLMYLLLGRRQKVRFNKDN